MRTILILLVLTFLFHESKSQDDCANAVALCAGSIISRTTVGATTNGTDPALTCGDNSVTNSVWFSVIGVVAGNCTITVSNISNNPGLEMQLYTGVCGALVPVGPCTTGSSATGGNMSMSFAIVAGTTYYIMVDGSSSNQEAFDILATTSDDAIVARPDADFNTSPFSGCSPLTVQLQNTTDLHGGSNITYAWRLDAGPYVPGSGSDTSITMTSSGSRTVTLRVCNTECGCKSVTQEIIVQDLFPSISYSPAGACIGTDITFSGSAVILPAVPFVPPAVTNWQWNFGDPSSGANNTAVGQVVNHIFTGGPGTYTVTLTADGNCGPDVIQTTVILRPRPTVSAGPPQIICEGTAATLNATTINLVNPILYNWSGPGIFSCDTCQSSSLSNLLPGGPYPITISVVDSFSCTADTTVNITVNPKPVVNAGSNVQVCQYSTTTLNAVPVTGSSPFSYLWSPTTGLNNPTISNPIASVSGPQTYCVVMTDSIGCASDPDCLDITIFPEPTINAALPVLCASSPTMQNTFTVSGAGAGSSYSWSLSPNYSLISGTNGDSSSVTVTFPTGVAASYTFTAVVVDGITSCRDTVQTVFTVTTGLNMSIAGPTQLCRGDVISLTASGASAYSWTASPAYIFSDSTLATQNVSPLVSTIFTVTGTSGTCSQTIYHNLTVAPKPIANAQPLLPVCGCTNVTLNGSGSTGGMIYHWSSAAGNLITDTLALNTTAQACINDIFTLVVIDPLSTCFEDTSIIVSASPKPPANIIINPDIICDGVSTNIILDGSGSNTDPGTIYHWTSSSGSSTIVDTTSLITTATASTTTIFTLTVTDVAGCDSVVSDTLRIYPVPSLNASNAYLCLSDPTLFSTLEIVGAASGSTYNWTSIPGCVSPGSTSSDSQTFDFVACGAGIYNFLVTVTDAITGCINDLNETVQVVSGVSLVLSPDTTVCEGDIVTLNVTGANSYLWSTADTASTLVLSTLTTTGSPYNFIVTGTIGGCSATDSVRVTVNPIPLTSPISGPITACESDTGIFYNVTPVSGNYSWTVLGGTITSGQNTDVISINWDSSGTGTISVVDTNSFGCPGPVQNITVIINALPDTASSIYGPITVCENSVQSYYVIPNAGSTYEWICTGGVVLSQTPSADMIQIQWGPSGSGSLSVLERNSSSCAGPDTLIFITINPRPLPPVVQGDASICNNSQSVYWIPFTAGSQWSWSIIGGTIDSVNANTDSVTVSWTSPGINYISVFEINLSSCSSDTTIFPVTVFQEPVAVASPDSAALCQNIAFPLTGTAIGLVQWISSGSGTFNDPTLPSPIYTPGISDTGFVQLQMIASTSLCPNDTATVVLYVSPAPIVTITGTSNTICFGQNDTLRVQGGGTYLWTPGGSIDSVLVVSPPLTTTYHVTVTNGVGCSSEDSVTVTVNPPGIPNAGSDQLLCRGDSATLFGTQAGGGGYFWSSAGDGFFIPNTSDQQVIYVPGLLDSSSGQVQIILTTTGYCLNLTDTLNLQITGLPSIDAGRDTTVTSGPGSGVSIPLSPTLLNASGVLWSSSGTGTFSPTDTTLTATYTPSDEDFTLDSVILTAFVTGACIVTGDVLTIQFIPFEIPNVFTPYPSSPGLNDYFEIKNLPRNTGLKIWNRWGLIVFVAEDYLNNWEAAGLEADVYYYALTTAHKEYKGWIQILRE